MRKAVYGVNVGTASRLSLRAEKNHDMSGRVAGFHGCYPFYSDIRES